MRDLLAEYKRTKTNLERRLRELEARRGQIRGEEALLLLKRIEALKDEIYCTGWAMDQITKYLKEKP